MKQCNTHKFNDLTPTDVVFITGKNYRTILRWIKEGTFEHAYRCPKCNMYLIPSKDVEAYIDSLNTKMIV